jgi:hypothetical protein
MSSQMKKKSTYYISTSVNEEIVEVVITGKVTKDSVGKLKNEVEVIAKSLNAKKLSWDVRALEIRFGYAETYFRITESPSFFHNINTTFVDIPENSDLRAFHEYRSKNAGLSLKWFTD